MSLSSAPSAYANSIAPYQRGIRRLRREMLTDGRSKQTTISQSVTLCRCRSWQAMLRNEPVNLTFTEPLTGERIAWLMRSRIPLRRQAVRIRSVSHGSSSVKHTGWRMHPRHHFVAVSIAVGFGGNAFSCLMLCLCRIACFLVIRSGPLVSLQPPSCCAVSFSWSPRRRASATRRRAPSWGRRPAWSLRVPRWR